MGQRRQLHRSTILSNHPRYLLRLLLLLRVLVLPLPADVDVLAVLVADRPALAAEHLAGPQSYRRPRVLVSSGRIDAPAEIDLGDDGGRRRRRRAPLLLEIAEARRDRRQFVAIGVRHRLRGLNAAGKAPTENIIRSASCEAHKSISKTADSEEIMTPYQYFRRFEQLIVRFPTKTRKLDVLTGRYLGGSVETA